MPTIPLTQGKSTVVDSIDYGFLMCWKWQYKKCTYDGYAARKEDNSCSGKDIFMHNVVAERMGIGKHPDHRNQDKLDNRRSNLRPATNSQQKANRGLQKNNKSGYKGVFKHKEKNAWVAYITINRKRKHLGYFPLTKEGKKAAARAYNRAAREAWGKYACLNPVDPLF